MALNFLGLGFSFGAKDMGLGAVQEKFTQGFQSIQTSLTSLGEQARPVFDKISAQATTGLETITSRFGTMQMAATDAFSKAATGAKPFTLALGGMIGHATNYGRAFKTGV